ncbi:MAG: DUF695 domain-containing protein [Bacteroidota bacterium]
MSFFKTLFQKQEKPITSYVDFWNWFQQHEKKFYNVLRKGGDVQSVFFRKLAEKLDELKDGFWYTAGMFSDDVAELVITPDGAIENIVFVEELVAAAPMLKRWKFTALKPALNIENVSIRMGDYKFSSIELSFYPIDHAEYPDEIDIVIVYDNFREEDKNLIVNGTYLFLDNYLGELNSVTTIDNIRVASKAEATEELIPILKLKDFLIWREKEFVEKYKGIRHNTIEDNFISLEATLENDLPLFAIVNSDLLTWDRKASHPWVSIVKIAYDGTDNQGLPNEKAYDLLNAIEEEILKELKDAEGYLNIGRQTADSLREIYFACVDFRLPSKVLHRLKEKYKDKLEIQFVIFKDKYWQTFNRFRTS